MSWWVYTLSDPIEPEHVRYVGKTQVSLKRRLDSHLKDSRKGTSKRYSCRWIWTVLNNGRSPIMTAVEAGDEDGWQEAEKRWIVFYRNLGHRLTNLTDGGEGCCGYKPPPRSAEFNERQSLAMPHAVLITFNGKTQSAARWSRELGIPKHTILHRYQKQWPLEKVFYKGRYPEQRTDWKRQPRLDFTKAQEIRHRRATEKITRKELAAQYGVSLSTVKFILSKRIYFEKSA